MKKIIVVDDDITIAESIQALLESEGYEVKHLINGIHLMEIVKEYKPDLIILDFLLPGKNGGELGRMLKDTNDTKKIPLLMLAASHQYRAVAKEVGIDLFLSKPFDIYVLLNEIKRLLKEQ